MNLIQDVIAKKILKLGGVAFLQSKNRRLSQKYREVKQGFLLTEEEKLVYLITRFPATYAVNRAVFSELKELVQGIKITSSLDIGAGPGSASFAAREVFETLSDQRLLEKDKDFLKLSKELSASLGITGWKVEKCDLSKGFDLSPSSDLTIVSYVLSELQHNEMAALFNLWLKDRANKFLVAIEPGTPYGFSKILALRAMALKSGLHILAPCSGNVRCSLNEGDWCHFSQRIERTQLHKMVKCASLNYEDEKYSYLVLGRDPLAKPYSRVICQPQRKSNHIIISFCEEGRMLLTRKNKALYDEARRANWGDRLYTEAT